MELLQLLGGELLFFIYHFSTLLLPTTFLFRKLRKEAIANDLYYIKFWKIVLFTLYICCVFNITGTGTIYEIGKYDELIRLNEITLSLFASEGIMTYVMNILMMVPFGFLLPYLWPKTQNMKSILLPGFLLSFIIEISQLLNRRNSATDDLIMNTVGTVLGYCLFLLVQKSYPKPLKVQSQILRYEHLLYIVVMFLGRFFFYNWRGLSKLLFP